MLRDCVDLDALEQNAQRVMRPELWVFCDTGADDEITSRENITAWRQLKLARACCATSSKSTPASACSARG